MLDELDKKIISLLEENGRGTLTQLAKSLGITDNTVAKRVETLLNNKAITIKAIPEPQKMGYKAQAMVAMSVKTEKVDELADEFSKSPNIHMISNTIGYYNLVILLSFFTWDALHQFMSELSPREEIMNMEVCFVKQALRPPFTSLNDSESSANPSEIDDIDRRIVEELSVNGRYTARYLSELLNISVSSAAQRINRLLANQVIIIRPIPNPSLFGKPLEVIIFLKSSQRHIKNIISNLRSMKEARGMLTCTGAFDYYLRLAVPNHDVLYQIVKDRIGLTNDVSRMETLIIFNRLSGVKFSWPGSEPYLIQAAALL